MSWLNKNIIFIFLSLFFIFAFLDNEIVFAESTCHGGAGGTLSTGINSGSFPEYYGIGKLVDNTYPNNLTCTKSNTYTCPSGNTTKIYINYDTESGYDFVKIYNGAGTLLENISGNSGGYIWKGPYSSNTLKFGFTSDSSITKTGFDIWKIECIAGAPPPPPPGCSSSSSQNLVAGDNSIDFQTPHNYTDNLDCYSNTYTCPSGYYGKAYVKYITESGYDYFYIYNAADNTYTRGSGDSGGFVWREQANTRQVKFRFTSYGSVT